MEISLCTKADFDQIRTSIAAFWGSDRTLYLHHPMLIREFGNTAYVIKDAGTVVAYLFGFYSQTESAAYVHLIGVREGYKRQGLGQKLYGHFEAAARSKGVQLLKAITTADNQASIRFHTGTIGMEMTGEPAAGGIKLVKDYSGPGMDRVVMIKQL